MIRSILSLHCALAFTFTGLAQTYFYIDQISVSPSTPAAQEPVTLSLHGNLSSTGAYIISSSAQVIGSLVSVTIEAADPGGFTVLVPHTIDLPLGGLAPGVYTVVIGGANVLDLAPTPQHGFVVAGDDVCADLDLVSIQWHALTDTALVIHVQNTNTNNELFDYPNFILFNSTGDTLAVETVSFFGIGDDNWHILDIHANAQIPDQPFNGRLELWTGFTSTLACTWELALDLCPPPPCITVQPQIQNTGGALVTGTFNWGVFEGGNVIASGSFTLTEEAQSDADTLCLPPGTYSMLCGSDGGPSGGALYYGLQVGPVESTPLQPVSDIIPILVPFSLYLPCSNPAQGLIPVEERPLFNVHASADHLVVTLLEATPGSVRVYDMQGKLVHSLTSTDASVSIPVRNWSSGIHVVRFTDVNGRSGTQRIYIHASR